MTKEELVAEIAYHTGFTKKDCQLFLDTFCGVVAESLERGEAVKIVNFGIFNVKECKARSGKNFASNTIQPIPSRKVPAFIPGVGLKEMVGGAEDDGC